MSFPIEKYNDELVFLALGGAKEIGMNLNVYCYKGQYILIDAGIGFADSVQYPGIDIVLPSVKFLEHNKQKIVGLVITHAHEDHIGAVPYIWNRLSCPVYT